MTNRELARIEDLELDGDPGAAALGVKGSRDTGPRVLEGLLGACREGPKLGLHSQAPVGTSAASRALTKEAVPASPSPSQLAVSPEFTVSGCPSCVSTADGESTQKGKHVFPTSIHSHFEKEKGTKFLLTDRQRRG